MGALTAWGLFRRISFSSVTLMSAFIAFTLIEIPPPEGTEREVVLVGFWGGVHVVVRRDRAQDPDEKNPRWIVTFRDREAAKNRQRKRARYEVRKRASED
jgi:hypothetical protein